MNATHASNVTAAALTPLNGTTTALNNHTMIAPPPVIMPPHISYCPVDVSLDGACRVPLHHDIFGGQGNPLVVETVILPPHQRPETHFDLEPCNDDDPDQVQVALLSQKDYLRHVERYELGLHEDDRAASPTTAMLLGCTRTLHNRRTSYKVDPSFHHRSKGHAAYANFVQKRGVAKQHANIHDVQQLEVEEAMNLADELSHEIDFAEGVANRMTILPGGGHLLDQYEVMSEPGHGSPYDYARAAYTVEQERERHLQQLEHNAFIQRWTEGQEHPRGPIHAGEMYKRSLPYPGLDGGEEWEARSYSSGGRGRGAQKYYRGGSQGRNYKRDLGIQDEVAWETRSASSHGRGGQRGAGPVRSRGPMNKRDLGVGEKGVWETRSFGSDRSRGGGNGRYAGLGQNNQGRKYKRNIGLGDRLIERSIDEADDEPTLMKRGHKNGRSPKWRGKKGWGPWGNNRHHKRW